MTLFGLALEETAAAAPGAASGSLTAVSSSATESEPCTVPVHGVDPAGTDGDAAAGPSGLVALTTDKPRSVTRMASWHENTTDASAENLTQRLAREPDQGFPRTRKRPGTEFSQGGWHHHSGTIAPPDPPNLFLVLLPFIALLVVTAAVMLGLSLVGGL